MKSLKNILPTIFILIAITFVQFITPQSVYAACSGIIYVSPSGIGTDGCSWATAYITLQDALADPTLASGDQIWVAAGTYYPDQGSGQTNNDRASTFNLENGVSLYGGFAGTESLLSQRNVTANVTILSGDIDQVAGNANNAYHVVTGVGVVSTAVLDGFTITAGNANGGDNYGGGMYLTSSSPTLRYLIFDSNAGGNGGGLAGFASSDATLTDVTFSNNSVSIHGGGIYLQDTSNPTLLRVTFSNNTSVGYGGGMAVFLSSPILTDVTFDNNQTTGAFNPGGGMYTSDSTPILNRVTFSNNKALDAGGGGMYNFASNVQMTNVTFANNSALRRGGAMANETSSPVLNNVTFNGNTATLQPSGGMANFTDSDPVIRNSILWGDTSQEIVNTDTLTDNPQIFDSIVQGGCPAGSTCTNVLTVDPGLGSLGNNGGLTDTMSIGSTSSARDVGNNATCAATDQRGASFPRALTLADPCDMGAYEFGGVGTVAGNVSATYGSTTVSLSATVTPNPGGGTIQFYINGNPVGSPAAVNAATGVATLNYNPSALSVGTYTVRADFSGFGGFPADTSNPTNNGILTINQAPLTVTANNKSRAYGATNPTFDATITGFVNGETLATSDVTGTPACTTAATPASPVSGSPYVITCTIGTLASSNYSFNFVVGNLTVTQATLTVTANDKSRVYGVANPAFDATITGFVNGETLATSDVTGTPACTTAATPASPVSGSPYAITCATGSLTSSNYSFNFVAGNLTITQATLTITANSTSKNYGTTVTFAGTEFTTSGLVGSDAVTSVTLTSAGAASTATVAGSPYAIVPSVAIGSGLGNYTITYTNGSLTVNPIALTITANSISKNYGDTVTFVGTEFTTSGLVGSDTATSVTLTSAGAASTATVAGSPYTIVPSAAVGTGLSNYTITYTNGLLTVNGIIVVPSITASDKIYDGTAAAMFTCSLSGVVPGDVVNCTGGTATFADKNVGNNKTVTATGLTLAGADSPNYSLSTTTATDTANITPLAITVTAVTDTKIYDGTSSSTGAPTPSIALAPGDTVTWTQTFDTKHVGAGKTLTPAGTITDGNGGNNYTVTFVNDTTSVITARAITVTAVTDTKAFDGTTSSAGVPTITGLIAVGDTPAFTQTFDTPLVGTGKTLTPAGSVNDGNLGANYVVTFTTVNTGTITGIPLDVTINQAGAQPDPTNALPINFTVVFSASVSDFATGDVSLSGTAVGGGTIATVTGSGTTYNVVVSGLVGNGTVIASISAGVASDTSGNPNNASTSTDDTVTYDGTAPTVTIEQAVGQVDPTNASPINFTVTFSDVVSNFATGDVSFTGSTAPGTLIGTVTNTGPTTYNVAVTGMTGNGTVVASIAAGVATDAAGNGNTASASIDNTVTYDTSGPIVTIGAPVPASTVAGPADFAVTVTGATTVTLTGADVTVNTTGTAAATTVTVTNGNTANPTITVSGISGSGTISITIAAGIASDGSGNTNLAASSSTPLLVDNAGPIVLFNSNTVPTDGATVSGGPTKLKVAFNENVKNDGSAGAANNTANYLLVASGPNRALDTASCLLGVQTDDVQYAVNSATYTNSSGSFVVTLAINGGTPLPVATYHLFVCGTTSIEDLSNNELNNGAVDTVIDFTVVQATASVPKTGFPISSVTNLPVQPEGLTYESTAMWMEIPSLRVKMSIVGVPKTSAGWDVTWLDKDAGWLDGSAYPTWKGNSVLTAHVWDALNKPGPFARLKELKYGDQVKIHAFGQVFTYEIRETTTISATDAIAMLKHQDKSWLTLITCEGFQELTKDYSSRRMVRAVLVSVTAEK